MFLLIAYLFDKLKYCFFFFKKKREKKEILKTKARAAAHHLKSRPSPSCAINVAFDLNFSA